MGERPNGRKNLQELIWDAMWRMLIFIAMLTTCLPVRVPMAKGSRAFAGRAFPMRILQVGNVSSDGCSEKANSILIKNAI